MNYTLTISQSASNHIVISDSVKKESTEKQEVQYSIVSQCYTWDSIIF